MSKGYNAKLYITITSLASVIKYAYLHVPDDLLIEKASCNGLRSIRESILVIMLQCNFAERSLFISLIVIIARPQG